MIGTIELALSSGQEEAYRRRGEVSHTTHLKRREKE
jgi:hypothetical protein